MKNVFYSNTRKRFCINKGFSKYVYKIADRTIINPDDKINDANNIEYTRIVSLFSINSISLKIEKSNLFTCIQKTNATWYRKPVCHQRGASPTLRAETWWTQLLMRFQVFFPFEKSAEIM